jgi:hypothetical protein
MSAAEGVVCGIDEAGLGPLLGPARHRLRAAAPAGRPGRTPGASSRASSARPTRSATSSWWPTRRRSSPPTSRAGSASRPPRSPSSRCSTAAARRRASRASCSRGILAPARAMVDRHPWYARLPAALPPRARGGLAGAPGRAPAPAHGGEGPLLLDAGVRVVPEGELNASYDETSNKSLSVWEKTLEALRHSGRTQGEAQPLIVIDRAGRAHALRPAARARASRMPPWPCSSSRRSARKYRLEERGGARRAHLVIVEQAEDKCFPVALASCIREVRARARHGGLQRLLRRPAAGPAADGGLHARRPPAGSWRQSPRSALAALPRQLLVRER